MSYCCDVLVVVSASEFEAVARIHTIAASRRLAVHFSTNSVNEILLKAIPPDSENRQLCFTVVDGHGTAEWLLDGRDAGVGADTDLPLLASDRLQLLVDFLIGVIEGCPAVALAVSLTDSGEIEQVKQTTPGDLGAVVKRDCQALSPPNVLYCWDPKAEPSPVSRTEL